ELVFTWESDPQHTRALSTIPECDNEDELEFQQAAMKKEIYIQPASSPEPTSPASSSSTSPSPSRYHSASSPPSPLPTPSPLTLHTVTRPNVHRVSMPTNQAKSELQVSRNASHTRSRSSPSTSVPTRGKSITRAKNPSGLRSRRDDGTVVLDKKKTVVKGAWRA
ncbi:hypothetical protein C0993_012340, partial [Termitomyces sp. T159_Od127]